MFIEIGEFNFRRSQQSQFKSGQLWKEWSRLYPDLFDDRDLDLVRTQGAAGTHFYEWLAAVLIFNTMGYLSLVEKYELPSHPRKFEIFKSIIDDSLLQFVQDYETYGGTQCPDLFVYSKDRKDWFFCEVKGQGDRLSPTQKEYFEELARLSKRPIRVVRFRADKSE